MMVAASTARRPPVASSQASLVSVASADADAVLHQLGSGREGLSSANAAQRIQVDGPNAIRAHRARAWPVLAQQIKSPILILLFVTAGVSLFLGDAANAVIIGVILLVSVGLGFVNEFRAQRAADALHDQLRHTVVVLRDGVATERDVVDLVVGDVVHVAMGGVVPADLRLLDCTDLSCDEGILTGESTAADKTPTPVAGRAALGDLTSCLLMGTIVQSGSGVGVVVATGGRTEFGTIALGLSTAQPATPFQQGLSRFSRLLLQVAIVLTTLIFVANLLLHRPLIESLLFSLAIAVGITPQLLPAVVSTSLAAGSRALAKKKVLVKRLVCIEDLGDLDLLVTDKTGTLTDGRISFTRAVPLTDPNSAVPLVDSERELLTLGLLATEADLSARPIITLGLNALDTALWQAAQSVSAVGTTYHRNGLVPFNHETRMTIALVSRAAASSALVVCKGSPEDVIPRCTDIPGAAEGALEDLYATGARVVAVASRQSAITGSVSVDDARDLTLNGFLCFLDQPKSDARASLDQLAALGIAVKVATGDNAVVAEKVCADLGMVSGGTLSGAEVDALSDDELASAAAAATIFARVSPEQKARIIQLLRTTRRSVGFLGDGVNDALALHQADIGISVDSAADVAKDAADVLLLDKDLGVLADGVAEGRRIFANTIKYVLMGTSSNFGNMFSAAVASVVLPFLPMLPGQILLNNLLYDTGQLSIPTDRVDPEQLQAPAHWNIAYIRRFMFLFGPISSIFDFATFALMIFVFHAAQSEFQAGWFIESIATQTLIIFAIRTRRVPFLRSRPSLALAAASLAVVAIGVWLPYSPVNGLLGFTPIPAVFFLALAGMVVLYLVVVEIAKAWFFSRAAQQPAGISHRRHTRRARVSRRAARFTAKATS